MSDEDLLAELLIEWEESLARGNELSVAELCREVPELQTRLTAQIDSLRRTAWMNRPVEELPDSTHPIPSMDPDEPPRVLAGRYRLELPVAEGGFARVWKATDLELLRTVAVKLPKLAHVSEAEVFLAEARRVARLKHPGIVPVFDVGREGDRFFIVSEFIEGGSLADRLEQGNIPVDQACAWILQLTEALDYAHTHGVVHRDIKPANILVDHHGRALLADFGIAQSAHKTGQFAPSVGTLPYMSPEQVAGRPVDSRSDLYSVGVLLCQLLTGRLPYRAGGGGSLRREIEAGSARFPSGFGRIPPRLSVICQRCLARDPAERYQSAGEMAAHLRKVTSANAGTLNWLLIAVTATVFALPIFAWNLLGPRVSHRIDGDTSDFDTPLRIIRNADALKLPVGIMVAPDGNLHVSNPGKSNLLIFSPTGELLKSYGIATGEADLLEFPQMFTRLPQDDLFAVGDFGNDQLVVFSFYGEFQHRIPLTDPEAPGRIKPRGVVVTQEHEFCVCSENTNCILVYNRDGVLLRRLETSSSEIGSLNAPAGMALGPGGELFVADQGNGRIVVLKTDGTVVHVLHDDIPAIQPFDLVFSRSGRLFVSDHKGLCVQVFAADLSHTGAIRRSPREFKPMGLAWFPNGDLAVVNYEGNQIEVFDVGESAGSARSIRTP